MKPPIKRRTEPCSNCAFCEYFDGGGLRRVEHARDTGDVLHGDCLCNRSPRFETTSLLTCDHFYPSTKLTDDQLAAAARGEEIE
jgi:hypothetical protein